MFLPSSSKFILLSPRSRKKKKRKENLCMFESKDPIDPFGRRSLGFPLDSEMFGVPRLLREINGEVFKINK